MTSSPLRWQHSTTEASSPGALANHLRPPPLDTYERPNGTSTAVQKFKLSDRVTWNSEAGHVSGTVIKIHTKNVDYKGYTHHATEDDPQYEIQSDKTDHIALHRGAALKLVCR
jgi:hypothetical protein